MVTWGDVARRLREPAHAAALVVAVVAVPFAVTLVLPAADRPAAPDAAADAAGGALVVVASVPTSDESALSPVTAATAPVAASGSRARRDDTGAGGPGQGSNEEPPGPGGSGEPQVPPPQPQTPVQAVSSTVDSTAEPVRETVAAAVTAVDEVVGGLQEVAGPLPPPGVPGS